jgi:hypothetical protein
MTWRQPDVAALGGLYAFTHVCAHQNALSLAQVENALNTLDRLQRMSPSASPALARASANLALARLSAVSLRRTSLTAVPRPELEAGVAEIQAVVGDMQQAAADVEGQVPEEVSRGCREFKRGVRLVQAPAVGTAPDSACQSAVVHAQQHL